MEPAIKSGSFLDHITKCDVTAMDHIFTGIDVLLFYLWRQFFLPKHLKCSHTVIKPLRVTGISDLQVWFVETKRYMDFTNPGSQAKEGSFFGSEATLEVKAGRPLLNPLSLAKDIANAHDYVLRLTGDVVGRLAMVAMLGIFVHANVTKSFIITAF
ncbi:hypothetical protein L1987_03583 [Smallanthus sonchifolius]|uniref:Uncharacterized protein n=1 Tax=Smallanthus sonchifolius TaxID=185202 RepID=A0ACB9KB22_9ASTR|nr:hypothetical protein L1987_03583 [Smallanthus sonchifolius]